MTKSYTDVAHILYLDTCSGSTTILFVFSAILPQITAKRIGRSGVASRASKKFVIGNIGLSHSPLHKLQFMHCQFLEDQTSQATLHVHSGQKFSNL